ncbi:unnamed protein product [Coregonus sp. 'balchen']|nr:unnamed protein product [Coregonus sp. 'balchen']
MAANMYRVGDYVFFENSSSNPYLIRRIEELNKTASGNVEAKVVCFYRRRDISHSLIQLADKHAQDLEEEKESPSEADLTDKQEHQLRHRELGKCSVALLNETEAVLSYLDKEDTFFYSLVYDPTQKTLKQIDQFLVVARAVGTFARALDCSSSVRQPSLHASAAAASRDITLFHAMDTLHRHGYDLSSALSVLVPSGGPVLCRDEMEEWSASEAAIIIEYYYMWKTTDRYVQQKRLKAAEAESKLKQVYIPTYNKPNPNQISVTNGKMATVNGAGPGAYQAAGGGRACESCYSMQSAQWYSWGPPNMQCRLCVSCWMYWKKYGGLKMPSRAEGPEEKTPPSPVPNEPRSRGHGPRQSSHMVPVRNSGSPKSSTKTKQAFLLHATHLTKLALHMCRDIEPRSRGHGPRQSSHMVPVRNSGSPKSSTKTKQAFLLHATHLTKLARHMCRDIVRLRRVARRPFVLINWAALRAEYMLRLSEGQVGRPPRIRTTQRSTLTSILQFLESRPAIHTPRSHRTLGLQAPPPRRLLSSLPHGPHGLLGKRSFHHHTRAEPEKRPENPGQTTVPVQNGRSSGGGGTRGSARGGVMIRKRRPNLIDAPDDSFFFVSRETRRARRLLSRSQLRRACRQPCEQITLRRASQAPLQGPLLTPPHPHPSLRMRGPIVIHD